MVRRPTPKQHDIDIERDGVRYQGRYSVQSGVVTVHFGWSSQATQIGESSAERIAKILLGELVIEQKNERA
jgi:hypothetical protein